MTRRILLTTLVPVGLGAWGLISLGTGCAPKEPEETETEEEMENMDDNAFKEDEEEEDEEE